MKIFRPSALFPFLQEAELHAKKRLSQNFLIDGNILRKIVREAQLEKGDLVIEIGPGPGALTEALLQAHTQVLAIEKDSSFAQALHRLQTPDHRLEIAEADVLSFPLEKFLGEKLSLGKKGKVVANLPYHLTTPILALLLPLHRWLSSLTLMVQKEVAARFVAPKGGADYSSLTLFLKVFSHPRICFTVEPTCFYPRPRVQSAVVHLTLQAPPELPPLFFPLVRQAFQQRRKMLRSSLRSLYPSPSIETALESLHLNPQARPQELSLEEFIQLFRTLQS